ncbi:dynamin family protein [Apodospora peruviana]|uniref:Dynamin family protein n=1 Tax=Apodospora peruviana TaxID=516989 RepID=A0AAE0MA37_9PEZI|nr:dynamin family protein [Apodospora peruviana]
MDTPLTSEAPSVDNPFDLQGLGKDQAELLDLIDSVQLAGIGDDIIPQIVVVGDQSSGKSSVLTSLTGIEFQRHSTACTKHPTEIRLRRNNDSSLTGCRTKVWILPDKSVQRTDQEWLALEKFERAIDDTPEMLRRCMQEASDLIAPRLDPAVRVNESDPRARFASKDKLIIEKSGPNMPALTLVDLPGLVKVDSNKQSVQDVERIEALTDMYMKDPTTTILAVVSGAIEFINATILKKVNQWDPEGDRTMGLLTKPDAADRENITDGFIDLMLRRDSKKYHFKLGWHVLLNPDARSNPTMAERKQREAQYWVGRKWAKLPDYMRGADALRARLNRQLQREIGRRLPAIQERIQQREDKCQADLVKLGKVLKGPKEKAMELGRLFGLSHNLIQQAVYGTFINPLKEKFFPDEHDPKGTPAQNLRAKAVEESNAFEKRFRELGLRLTFTEKDGKTVDVKAKHVFVKKVVEPLLPQIQDRSLPGNPNMRAPYRVFRTHASREWPLLAKEYEDKIEKACKAFLEELKEYAWPPRMRVPLEEHHLGTKCKGLWADARQELDRISTETFHMEIQPFDRAYERCIEEVVRTAATAAEDGKLKHRPLTEAELVAEQMLAYYKLAEPIFIRNIIYQVAERHLLLGMMKIFEITEMLGIPDETVDKITAEDAKAEKARKVLEAEMEHIHTARQRCDIIARRTTARLDINDAALFDFGATDDDSGVDVNMYDDQNGYERSDDGHDHDADDATR